MAREFELKYAATPEIQNKIRGKFGDFEEISMETTYFDTPDGKLSARHITLRSRQENGVCVCTLKTPGVGHGHGEWDAEAPWCVETAEKLWRECGEDSIPFSALIPVCGAKFIRRAALVELPDCTVEVALDAGVLLGGGKAQPLCEVEVEVKAGSEEAAVAFAMSLAAEFHLSPEPDGKFRRASALAKGE